MKIIGISAYFHDSAACLVIDGEVICAAQEERFSRKKHDAGFPRSSLEYCLNAGKISPNEIDYIVFYEKPFLKFDRLIETYLAFAPKGFKSFATSLPLWSKDKLFQKSALISGLSELWGTAKNWSDILLFSEHHLSHAASAFYPSPFQEAAILTMDAVGEWATTSIALGNGNKISIIKEINFPHSIGLLYSAITYYLGFKVNSGEYKVMGLAPYGEPKYLDLIKKNLIEIKQDGSFRLDMSYFNYCTGLTMTNDKFANLFNGQPRKPESLITQREMDIAASIQVLTEEIVLKIARNIKLITGSKNLCLAGGVALNCVANGKLHREKIFENIWIQPAAGDAGGALGAALSIYYLMLGNCRVPSRQIDGMKGSLLGPNFNQSEINDCLIKLGANFSVFTDSEIVEKTALALADGNSVGWMNGRMEFGPRSLGNRSILADPRAPNMQKQLNLKIKFRESFRPFAPSVLSEDVSDYFELEVPSPYMLLVADVKQNKRVNVSDGDKINFGFEKLNTIRSEIPAVTHVDFSARIQTVHKETNPKYYELLKEFKKLTGCSVLVNTSFNVRGEPIVCTPEDAFKCFMGTDLDILVIGNAFMVKNEQSIELSQNYKDKYSLD